MKRPKARGASSPQSDLKRLGTLAYHRLENSEDLVRKFHSFRPTDHADLENLRRLYDWLLIPITLWPIDIEALFRAALARTTSGKRLHNTMLLLIDLLPPLPSDRTQRAVSEHEHSVQRGNYEPLIRARHKYVQIESTRG